LKASIIKVLVKIIVTLCKHVDTYIILLLIVNYISCRVDIVNKQLVVVYMANFL